MQAHKYDTGDVIRETVDLEHWVGTTSHETARLIDLVVPK
jgi:quercetin dioxygenase-like cupin family protein